MSRKGARQTVFVCSGIINTDELISKIIPATSPDEAASLFFNQYSVAAKEVLGPFYKKMMRVLETTRVLKFSNKTKKAIYNEWEVNAFLLEEPVNQAYLVFIKRIDNKKVTFPKGTITVPISDLRFI